MQTPLQYVNYQMRIYKPDSVKQTIEDSIENWRYIKLQSMHWVDENHANIKIDFYKEALKKCVEKMGV